jgi:hypothetical protein
MPALQGQKKSLHGFPAHQTLYRASKKHNPRETNLRVLKHVWKIPHLCIMLKAIRMFYISGSYEYFQIMIVIVSNKLD